MKLNYEGPSLSDNDMLKLEAIVENGPVKKMIGYHNIDTSCEEDVPSGLLTIHDPESKVHVDNIPEKTFQYLVVCPIYPAVKGQVFTDADFQISDAKLNEAVPQYSSAPPSMYNRTGGICEKDAWNAELGEDGVAGIFKSVGRHAKYYVGVCAGVGLASQEFKESLKDGMTFEQLLDDPKFKYTRFLAQRNAQRLAYNVARACKVRIAHTRDATSKKESQPQIAVPDRGFQQAQSTITALKRGYDGTEAVGVFHDVRPVQEANDMCFVYAGPYDGIAMFNMNGNAVGHALPASTGRSTIDPATPYDMDRNKGVTWEEAPESLIAEGAHPDLHPDAFRPIDDTFLENMKKMGWKQQGTRNREYLVPVRIKISNPELKRV